jgi:hypothetical protein
MIKFIEKQYSGQLNYDETDSLKKMKDSDILSQKKRSNSNLNAKVAGTAAGVGGVAYGAGRLAGALKGKPGVGKVLGVAGGITSALLAGSAVKHSQRDQRKQNSFYNDRLEYAQRQAVRRENRDFRDNMTFREGYTY